MMRLSHWHMLCREGLERDATLFVNIHPNQMHNSGFCVQWTDPNDPQWTNINYFWKISSLVRQPFKFPKCAIVLVQRTADNQYCRRVYFKTQNYMSMDAVRFGLQQLLTLSSSLRKRLQSKLGSVCNLPCMWMLTYYYTVYFCKFYE